jgi:hypothetical protein
LLASSLPTRIPITPSPADGPAGQVHHTPAQVRAPSRFRCSGFGSGPRRAGSVVLRWGWWTGAAAWLERPSPGVGLSGRSCADGLGSRIEFTGGSPPFGFEAAQLSCDLLLVLGLRVIVVVCVCVYEGLATRLFGPQGGRTLLAWYCSKCDYASYMIRMFWYT